MAMYNLLLKTLNQLSLLDANLFIWHLTKPGDDGFSEISPGDLSNGAPRHEVVKKIVDVYGSKGPDVTIGILRLMQQNRLALTLENNAAGLKAGPTATPTPTATAAPHSSGPSASSVSGVDFLTQHKWQLEQRIGNVRRLLSALYDARIVNDEDREEVESKSTRIQKNAALLAMVKRKGAKAQEALYQALREVDPPLIEDLGGVV